MDINNYENFYDIVGKECKSIDKIIDQITDIIEIAKVASSTINSCFGKQLVYNITAGFLCITIQCYYMLNIIRSRVENSHVEYVVTLSFHFISLHILEFFLLFNKGHSIKEAVRFGK